MVFSSLEFLLFLTAVLSVYWLVCLRLRSSWRLRAQHWLLLAASYYFYMSWNATLVLLIILSTAVDYLIGAKIHSSASLRLRRALLIISLVCNLGLLAVFKYANFFLDSMNGMLGVFAVHFPVALNILLPVGISFYTFQSMSYTIDIYRGKLEPTRSFADFALFVSFFPQLVAGPIVRASQFLPQLRRPKCLADLNFRRGVNYLLMGLVKKLLIADWLSTVADPVFASPADFNPVGVWMGVIAYALQIYCDFSGYSDMAIGTAALLGYKLPDNFNMPYLSCSVSEFWTRWHISLSSWLRDYLYVSLGGNRRGIGRTYRNLMIVMFLGGLWHGAQWTFVAWGCLHGIALMVHKWFRKARSRDPETRPAPSALGQVSSWAVTMVFVCLTWVFFRSPTFGTAGVILSKMCLLDTDGVARFEPVFGFSLLATIVAHLVGVRAFSRLDRSVGPILRFPFEAFGYAMVLLALLLLAPVGTQPFIYFQF